MNEAQSTLPLGGNSRYAASGKISSSLPRKSKPKRGPSNSNTKAAAPGKIRNSLPQKLKSKHDPPEANAGEPAVSETETETETTSKTESDTSTPSTTDNVPANDMPTVNSSSDDIAAQTSPQQPEISDNKLEQAMYEIIQGRNPDEVAGKNGLGTNQLIRAVCKRWAIDGLRLKMRETELAALRECSKEVLKVMEEHKCASQSGYH